MHRLLTPSEWRAAGLGRGPAISFTARNGYRHWLYVGFPRPA
jgi:hypothetical protein